MVVTKSAKKRAAAGKRDVAPTPAKREKAIRRATDVVVDLYGRAIKELANR